MRHLAAWPALAMQCWLLLALSACGTLSSTNLEAEHIAQARAARGNTLQADVDALVRPLAESLHTPGVVVGVLGADGGARFFGFGTTRQDGGSVPDADTLFAIGSLSKGFLAGAAALLVDEGALAWGDTLPALLPPAVPMSYPARQVTLEQLATHTSGMPRQPLDELTLSLFVRYLFTGESFYGHLDRDYALNYLAKFRGDSAGEPIYSNIGYGILSDVLARRAGQTVVDLVEQRVIHPLGLRCTSYRPEQLPCFSQRAFGYAGDQPKFIHRGQPTPDWQFTELMQASAGLYSNARDLLGFAAAHFHGGTRLHAVLADNTRVRSPAPINAAAVAWIVDTVDGVPIAYQVGFVAGFTSYIGLDMRHRTAVVMLQNSFNWDVRAGHQLLLRMAYRARPVLSRSVL